jgi:hypothetical protein
VRPKAAQNAMATSFLIMAGSFQRLPLAKAEINR